MIPFVPPAQFLAGLSNGDLVRYGTIIKNATSGQIVGHLQETKGLQSVLSVGASFNPTSVTGVIGIAQNVAISNKLNAMQAMMGTLQTLQIATLASSVVGIGVTAATAAMILHRLKGIDQALERIEGSVADLPAKWRDMDLRKTLGRLQTSTERLQEAELRPDADTVVRGEEEKLNHVFNELHEGICEIVIQARVDPGLLRSLLAGLALCGSAQFKALIWLDMKEAAAHRAQLQCTKLRELAFDMPRHAMAQRLIGGSEQAAGISKDCSEIRMRTASQPDLAQVLIREGIHGRDFIDRIQSEETEPLLILPTT